MIQKIKDKMGADLIGALIALIVVFTFFSFMAGNFLSLATFDSVSFQLPELGLLTLAMLLPLITGGINLSITFTANLCGLTAAWILHQYGGLEASYGVFFVACLAAIAVGAIIGLITGTIIAYTNAHSILVTLAMMIFLRGLGEFLTQGGDISGFPSYLNQIGHGSILGIPIPLIILIVCVILWHIILTRTKLGFGILMSGSNIEATRYSGLNTKKIMIMVYTLSGVMCAVAGIIMLSRFNSVRVGHGEFYLLITVLAAFLGGVDPFGGFGRVFPVFIALIVLQLMSSGLNLMGANQHLATAMWGILIIIVMAVRTFASTYFDFMRR